MDIFIKGSRMKENLDKVMSFMRGYVYISLPIIIISIFHTWLLFYIIHIF